MDFFPLCREWQKLLKDELEKDRFRELVAFLEEEYRGGTVYPPRELVFEAFNRTLPCDVKVVVLGQDPYHGRGQAHGLAFSAKSPPPPSLRNVFRELEAEYGKSLSGRSADLTGWAEQGVLLLNAILTVREGRPLSHKGKGWEEFTDAAIRILAQRRRNLVFLLWGANACRKKSLICPNAHLVLEAPHPSPLSASRGFFGCGHFLKANEYIAGCAGIPINWLA